MMLSVGTEREADADVYARHAPELVRFATVLAGPSGADDLVASAVLKAFTNPGWSGVQNQRFRRCRYSATDSPSWRPTAR